MSDTFTFPGSQGIELAARLDRPTGPVRAMALFAHCFTCGKDIAAASRISAGLVARGFAVLRFDFTGLGASEGEFANTNFSSNVQDLCAAADMLREQYMAPSLLVGHSLGGAAVLAAARHLPEVRAVATIAAPFDPAHVVGVFTREALDEIAEQGEADVELAGRRFHIRQQFIDDVAERKLADDIRHLDAALLVMHSPTDALVNVRDARAIYDAARHPKSFVSLEDADHLLSSRDDSAYAADVLAAWSSRYLPRRDDPSPAGGRHEGTVVVEENGIGTYAQTIYAGTHTLYADEPIGTGDDTGPTPYDLLLSGLGACTSMTLRMYAQRKGLALDGVKVTLTHTRTHAEDCDDPAEHPCRVEIIDRVIEVTGDLSEAERARLLEIANKCPVHRTLTGDLRVATRMA